MLFALASGAALLGIVGWSLVQTTRHARDREQLAAQHDAHDLAVALRAALQSRAVLELAPPATRLQMRDGSLVVDDAVGWLDERPTVPPDAVVAEKLRQAQYAEFVQLDPAAAARQFDELLDAHGPQGDHALATEVAAAWQAVRAAAATRQHDSLARLDTHLAQYTPADVADARVAHAVAARMLLTTAVGQPIPAALARLFQALPPALANPTLARLSERGVDTTPLVAAHAAVVARRGLLLRASKALREAPQAATVRGLGDDVLVWFPADEAAGGGDGALLPHAFVATLPGLGTSRAATVPNLPPIPDRGRVVGQAGADHEEVVPASLWIAPLPPTELTWLARPEAMLAAALALVLVFASSAIAMLRAFAREAAAMRLRSEFLTGVTHELKTPVASMRLVAEVLRDDDVPTAKQREYVTLLAGEATRLAALVDNVLDLGQLERGERAYDLRAVDLAEVVRDVVAAFAPLAMRSGMTVTLLAGCDPALATADAGALAQALLNVCENARKYAAAGQRLQIATTRDRSALRIAVRDFGPGVPAHERDAIFERFRRGSAHRHGSIPGVGLGLFLARAIVQRHGGTLHCEAPPEGPGACFVFCVPLAESPS